jgi:hypothetical protein
LFGATNGFIDYALWNPFALLKGQSAEPTRQTDNISADVTIKEETEMDASEFEIPSAILAAALVEKSELKGKDLEMYAANMQRWLVFKMKTAREKEEATASECALSNAVTGRGI